MCLHASIRGRQLQMLHLLFHVIPQRTAERGALPDGLAHTEVQISGDGGGKKPDDRVEEAHVQRVLVVLCVVLVAVAVTFLEKVELGGGEEDGGGPGDGRVERRTVVSRRLHRGQWTADRLEKDQVLGLSLCMH